MKNLYHKVAVAAVCTALSFTLGANKEAKAATISLTPTSSSGLAEYNFNFGYPYLNGQANIFTFAGPVIYAPPIIQARWLAEFSMDSFYSPSNKRTFVSRAILQTVIYVGVPEPNYTPGLRGVSFPGMYVNPGTLGVFGYVGNGVAGNLGNFGRGKLLTSVDISSSSSGDFLNFDVTSWVNENISNGNQFSGFNIRSLGVGGVRLGPDSSGIQPRLIIETDDDPEPVPEPTTIFGSALALSLGGWLKRKKSGQENKTTSR